MPLYVPILFAAPLAADRLISAGRASTGGRRAWGRATALVPAAARVFRLSPGAFPQISDRRRRYGFDEFEFEFGRNRARYGDMCVASATLPAYDIARASIGQIGGGPFWRAEFRPGSGGRKDLPAP